MSMRPALWDGASENSSAEAKSLLILRPMLVRLLFTLAAAAMVGLSGCASTDPVPAPQPVNNIDETSPVTGGELFNGNY